MRATASHVALSPEWRRPLRKRRVLFSTQGEMQSFDSCFWAANVDGCAKNDDSEDSTGFNRLLDRLRFGRKQTGDLIKFFEARLAATEAHCKSLLRLTKTSWVREVDVAKDKAGLKIEGSGSEEAELVLVDDPRCVAVAMQAVALQVREEAALYQQLADTLRQIIASLRASLAEQERVKHKHKLHVKEAAAKKRGHRGRVVTARDAAYRRHRERDALLSVNVEALSARQADKHEERLRRAKEAASTADLEYRHQVDRVAEAYALWRDDMSSSFNGLQQLELGRLTSTADLLNSFCLASEQAMQSSANAFNCLRNNRIAILNANEELLLFIAKRQTGSCVPEAPVYHGYYVDDPKARPANVKSDVRSAIRSETVGAACPERSLSRSSTRTDRSASLAPSLALSERSNGKNRSGSASLRTTSSRTAANSNGGGGHRSTLASIMASDDEDCLSPPSTPRLEEAFAAMKLPAAFPSQAERRNARTPRPPFRCTAVFAYEAQGRDELTIREGDVISVTDTSEDPWWFGSISGRGAGSFPSNFVEVA